MGTTSTTRSIEIEAPVARVFAFLADPVKAQQSSPEGRGMVISDIVRTADGAVTSYRWRMPIGVGPLHWNIRGSVQVADFVQNQRFTEKWSVGPVDAWTFEPSQDGTRLTFTGTVSSPIPLLDKVKVFVATQGRGQARNMDQILAQIKKVVEAEESG